MGDEIVAVEDKPVEYYMAQTREFISCSNGNDVLAATADQILRTKENRPLSIRYRRDGVTRGHVSRRNKDARTFVGITFGNTTGHSRCSKIRSIYLSDKLERGDTEISNGLKKPEG